MHYMCKGTHRCIWMNKREQGFYDSTADHVVATLGAIARDVGQGPESLLTHVNVLRVEQLDE